MTFWLNHVTVLTAAGSSHTVDPNNPTASGGVVKDGTAFAPTSGRFLQCVVAGPVTSTTPTGWGLVASSVNTSGLYNFTKTAAGSDTVVTTHNSALYQVTFDFYEFSAGTSFGSWTGGSTLSGSTRTLSGLTGSNIVMTSVCSPNTAGTWAFTGATGIIEYDTSTGGAHHYGIAFTEGTSSSVGVAATLATHEQVMSAFTGYGVPATVTPPAATATAAAVVPTVTAASTVSPPAATATASAVVPAVTGTGDATVLPPVATATATAVAPSLGAGVDVAAAVATAVAAAVAPSLSLGATVAAVPATATAGAIAPFVSDGSGSQTVLAPAATATASAVAPVWTQVYAAGTDTGNALDGRSRGGLAAVTIVRPVAAAPTNLATKVDKALAYPVPTMVDGRPT